MLHWMVTAPQYDGRFIGRYTQEWTLANAQTAIEHVGPHGLRPGERQRRASSGATCTGRSARTSST